MGGGKGGGQVSSNTTATPWSGVQPYLTGAYGQLQQAHANGPPQYFPGSTVAPMSGSTAAALSGMQQRAMQGSPLTSAAQSQLASTMGGDYLNAGNPYFEGATQRALAPITRAYQEQVLPGIDARFSMAGRLGGGGSAYDTALGNATQDYLRQVGDTTSAMAYQNYGDERNRQIQGMLFAPQLANQDYTDLSQLGYVGGVQEQYQQQAINDALARWNYQQTAPMDWTTQYIAALQGTPWSQSTTSNPGGSPFLQQAGGVLSGLGSLGMLGSALGLFGGGGASLGALAGGLALSDERLKEDIKPVGLLDSGLPVYSYRFKGSPVTQIGLLAQDVEMVHPEAVHDIGGVKAVDYARAVE